MVRLLQIEFIKLWNNRASKILIIAYFALICSITLIAVVKWPFAQNMSLADLGIFNFPYIWHHNTFITAILKLFFAIVIVSMMSNEYSNKTLKQNLIDGLSKREFIASKFLTVVSFSAISTVFVFIVSFILGLIYSDFDEVAIIFSDMEYLLAFFIKLVGFFSFCLFLGIFVKRSAFALGFLILWAIFEQLLYGLLGWKIVSWKLADKIKDFFPLESMANLIEEPYTRLNAVQSIADQLNTNLRFDYQVHWYEVLIVIVWTTIFIYLSYTLLKKRDL